MKIKEILKNYAIEDKTVDVNGKKYPYFFTEYHHQNSLFAQYFIVDLVNCPEYVGCEEEWKDIEKFEQFECILLEDAFFSSAGDTRFNLYLILFVKSESSLLFNSAVRGDFKYARKVILKEEELEDFFVNTFPLQREKEIVHRGEKKGNREIIEELHKLGENAVEIAHQEISTNFRITSTNLNRKNLKINNKIFEILMLCGRFERLFLEENKREPQGKIQKNIEDYRIQKIRKVQIENFRCFDKPCQISFGKVNLLFGENGVGKTTLLEAIELGITGINRKNENKKFENAKIEVECLNEKGGLFTFYSTYNYENLAERWYGVTADTKEEFNRMFNQYNYFDTGFASAFAIEGQKKENLLQLQRFLGIEKIEEIVDNLKMLYKKVGKLSEENVGKIEKELKREKKSLIDLKKPSNVHNKYILERRLMNSQNSKSKCETGQSKLEEEVEVISLEEILNAHIKKIECIFKLLIASNEYAELKVIEGEIVAIRNGSNESISMAKMSTGQKVCLALAFMFALFLSNEKSPNVILLDEPAANLDDLHMLNLLDVLRRLALSDTQIFFTTANPSVAQLFRRKFSFLEDEFRYFNINESEQDFKVRCEIYSPYREEAVKVEKIF